MNPALRYLWLALLRRQALHWACNLRRPATLLGFGALLALAGVVFAYRHESFYGDLVRGRVLAGGALLLAGASLFKGFCQRGLTLEPPDVEFLFTSPFTPRQVVLYRLWTCYLFSGVQGLAFASLFAPHLPHPLLAFLGMTLFQAACFHLSFGASVFAGTLSEHTHHRLRCMLLVAYFLAIALYLRAAWDLRVLPGVLKGPVAQLLFYPALTLADGANVPALHAWALVLLGQEPVAQHPLGSAAWCLGGFGLGAAATLALLLKLVQRFEPHLYEASLVTTTRRADKRIRLREGRHVVELDPRRAGSYRRPTLRLFRGVGAIFWKNLVAARRSRRELWLGFGFATVFAGLAVALLWVYRLQTRAQGQVDHDAAVRFSLGVAMFLAVLPFFLQRLFPFDFRRDGRHLLEFRTLPVSPLALALVEVALPSAFCLAAQGLGLAGLVAFGSLDWLTLSLVLLTYPAIAFALNGVWNLQYLLAAAQRAAGSDQGPSAVGSVLMVGLSFLVCAPAGWILGQLGQGFDAPAQTRIAVGAALGVQCLVDGALLGLMAWCFHRFELARPSH